MRQIIRFLAPLLLLGWLMSSEAAPGNLPGGPKIVDCNKAKDPGRCEARIAARVACKNRRGSEKRQCMNSYAQTVDCSRAPNPKQCASQQQAIARCSKLNSKNSAYKACLRKRVPNKTPR